MTKIQSVATAFLSQFTEVAILKYYKLGRLQLMEIDFLGFEAGNSITEKSTGEYPMLSGS